MLSENHPREKNYTETKSSPADGRVSTVRRDLKMHARVPAFVRSNRILRLAVADVLQDAPLLQPFRRMHLLARAEVLGHFLRKESAIHGLAPYVTPTANPGLAVAACPCCAHCNLSYRNNSGHNNVDLTLNLVVGLYFLMRFACSLTYLKMWP